MHQEEFSADAALRIYTVNIGKPQVNVIDKIPTFPAVFTQVFI